MFTDTAARPPGRSTRRNSERPRAGSGKNISPRLQTTASKVSSENERACASSTKTDIARFAEALACLLGHGGGDIGGRNVTGRADREEGRLGRKPRASSDVKDAHTPCNAGRAQNERHEVSRNVRKGSVVLGRRLPLKDELLHAVPNNSFADGPLEPKAIC